MLAYELYFHCKNLLLQGQNEDGSLEWLGTRDEWTQCGKQIKDWETAGDSGITLESLT